MREVVYLRLSGELSFREIGQILKISENAVKKRLERARNSFKKQYEEAEKNDF